MPSARTGPPAARTGWRWSGWLHRLFCSRPGEVGAKSRRKQLLWIARHYGEHLGLRNARKHIGWYLESSARAVDAVKSWRRQLCTEESPARVLSGLSQFYDETLEAAA